MKYTLRTLIIWAAPLFAFFVSLRNRLRCNKEWQLVVSAPANARYLVERLHAMGYKILLFDSSPGALNWLYAARTFFVSPYNPNQYDFILRHARIRNINCTLMQSDDTLVPHMAALNQHLNAHVTFSEKAIAVTASKQAMRNAFAQAGLYAVPSYVAASATDLETIEYTLPAVIKPDHGQGAKHAYLCNNEQDLKEYASAIFAADDQAVIENFLPGRQFNIDGVLHRGTAYFHMITEECYDLHAPRLMPCWFFFGVPLAADMLNTLLNQVRLAVAAADFTSGAFHCEVKLDAEDNAHVIDMGNRMGGGFPRQADLVMGCDFIRDYVRVMQDEPVQQIDLSPQSHILRYYNYTHDPAHQAIRRFAQQYDACDIRFDRNTIELYSESESPIRQFLESIYALRHHH